MTIVTVRAALPADADAISRVAQGAIREVNARDYAPDQIARTIANFSPERMLGRMATRRTFVASAEHEIVGTAALGDAWAHSVFVSPSRHGGGIGRKLMEAVEAEAAASGLRELLVSSSLSAVGFYERLGYVALGQHTHPDGDTITMRKVLVA